MHIPLTLVDATRLSCASQKDWAGLAWLFDEKSVRPRGAILALSFRVPLPHPLFEFDYVLAHQAFSDPRVAELFGDQGCGLNLKGGAAEILPYAELLDIILERSAPYSIATLGHIVGHALHPMVQEMTYDHLRDDNCLAIYERVGVNPRDRSELVIGFYIEPAYALESVAYRSENLRVGATLSFLQDLFDGKVSFELFRDSWKGILHIEEVVRPKGHADPRIKQTFTRPGHHEGNPAASWPYIG